jgi:hypothetical protein
MIAARKLDRVDGKLHFRKRRISITFRFFNSELIILENYNPNLATANGLYIVIHKDF